MQAVQRIEREKRMDGGKKKEEVDDPHTSAAKRKRPLRNGAELLPAERPSCSCVSACIRHYFPRQGRRLEPRWRASREFHPSEVLSKLRAGVELCIEQRMVMICGQPVNLTQKEFDLLLLLASNPKRVFTYEMIMDIVWHEDYTFYSRKAIHNHISNIKRKLRTVTSGQQYIVSVHGVGYKFDVTQNNE